MTLSSLPSTHEEAWRWSDLSALPALAEARPGGGSQDPEALFIGCGGPRLLFVDGAYQPDRSSPGPIRVGETDIEADGHPLGALAGRKGWRLELGRDHAPAAPIEIVHIATGGANHLAAQIDMADDAQASFVESYAGSGWANRLTQIRLGRSARAMRAVRLLGDSGFQSLTERAELDEGASLDTAFLGAGGADTRIDVRAALTAEGAYAEIGGALLARGKQRHDVNIVLRHASPEGASRQVWRMVGEGQATASVAARVEVARHAQKTDAEQSLKGLLIDRTATINLKPELEIFADDVKCAHGATVGELSRDALFYLAARGVPPLEARALLTRAFVADALDRIGEEKVREAFRAGTDAWLGGVA